MRVEKQRNPINVAVSRAKRAFIVFGDHAALAELELHGAVPTYGLCSLDEPHELLVHRSDGDRCELEPKVSGT